MSVGAGYRYCRNFHGVIVQSIFLLWLLWGLVRVPLNSFSGEVVSRRFTVSQALAAGRWAQSQTVDTLFYDRDKTQSPKEMGELSNPRERGSALGIF